MNDSIRRASVGRACEWYKHQDDTINNYDVIRF